MHPHEPETVYVFPLVADGNRIPTDAKCRVFRSRDAGSTWEALEHWAARRAVVRAGAAGCDVHGRGRVGRRYLGTRDGCVYASADAGDT